MVAIGLAVIAVIKECGWWVPAGRFVGLGISKLASEGQMWLQWTKQSWEGISNAIFAI